MAILTYAALAERHACRRQLRKFKRRFGYSVNITVKLCVAEAEHFDFWWAATCLLAGTYRRKWLRVRDAAFKRYAAAQDHAYDLNGFSDEYEAARAAANTTYEQEKAAAFARLYNEQCKPAPLKSELRS